MTYLFDQDSRGATDPVLAFIEASAEHATQLLVSSLASLEEFCDFPPSVVREAADVLLAASTDPAVPIKSQTVALGLSTMLDTHAVTAEFDVWCNSAADEVTIGHSFWD